MCQDMFKSVQCGCEALQISSQANANGELHSTGGSSIARRFLVRNEVRRVAPAKGVAVHEGCAATQGASVSGVHEA